MNLYAHVIPVMALIALTVVGSLPPNVKPELGCDFSDLRPNQSQVADWRSESKSDWPSGSDQAIDGVCELRSVPLRKTDRLKMDS